MGYIGFGEIGRKLNNGKVNVAVTGQSKLQQFNKHIDLLCDLVTFAQKLLGSKDSVQLVKMEDREKVGEVSCYRLCLKWHFSNLGSLPVSNLVQLICIKWQSLVNSTGDMLS